MRSGVRMWLVSKNAVLLAATETIVPEVNKGSSSYTEVSATLKILYFALGQSLF
jgi:hypothetical protein